MSNNFESDLNLAKEAMLAGGKLLQNLRGFHIHQKHKLVALQEEVIYEIKQHIYRFFPDDIILTNGELTDDERANDERNDDERANDELTDDERANGEPNEGELTDGEKPVNRFAWDISFIEGLSHAVRGIPHCSMTLTWGDEEVHGAVLYDPLQDHLYYCGKGKGSYLNSNRIRVGDTENWADSFITLEPSLASSPLCKKLIELGGSVQIFSNQELNLAWVSANITDMHFMSSRSMPTGEILLIEAGGILLKGDIVTVAGNQQSIDAFEALKLPAL